MATYDTWGGSWASSWGLSWTRNIPAPAPTPTFTPDPPAGVSRRRRKIILRVDGREYEIEDLARALEVIKAAKAGVPEVAQDTAVQIVRSGKKVSEARKAEAAAIELVEAPSSVQSIIEDRIAEMQRFYWRSVAAFAKALEEDDEEVTVHLLL